MCGNKSVVSGCLNSFQRVWDEFCDFGVKGLCGRSAQFGPTVGTRHQVPAPQHKHFILLQLDWATVRPSLVLIGRERDQGAVLLAVALLPVLLLVLEVQYDPFDLLVIRGGRPALLLPPFSHRRCLLPLLLLLTPLYGRGHYVIEEGEEAIDPIRALLS